MPYSMCQKLNIDPKKSNIQIVQLDRSRIILLGEMRNLFITLSINSWAHQTIDILVEDILESYGLLLRWYWSSQLNGYFTSD